MPFLIDGYNLLWSIQKASAQSDPISDVQLCHILSRYLKRISEKGEIVFDGKGPPDKGGFDNISRLEIIFVGMATDADTVIEHKIQLNTAPKRLTVVSSDRRLRDAARARKAVSVKSDAFWGDVQKQLRRKRTLDEPAAKREGINQSETEQWLKLFDLDQ